MCIPTLERVGIWRICNDIDDFVPVWHGLSQYIKPIRLCSKPLFSRWSWALDLCAMGNGQGQYIRLHSPRSLW